MLPEDGVVPGLPDWRWIPTPGHTPGHVSFFRDSDRTLIAGDAVVATRQESLIFILLQRKKVWRPPAYFTPDWEAARDSVHALAALEPASLGTGHGQVLRGSEMRDGLHRLAQHFEALRPGQRELIERTCLRPGPCRRRAAARADLARGRCRRPPRRDGRVAGAAITIALIFAR